MKKSHKALAFVLLLSSASLTANARQWTLQECISYALSNNISLQKTRVQHLSAIEDVKQSKAALLPSLSGSTSHNVSYNPWPETGSYTIAGSRVQSQVDKVFYNGSYGINANWTVWNGNRNRNQVKLNQMTADQAALDSAVTANTIQEQIAQLFVQILYSQEAVEVDKATLETSKKNEERGKEFVKVGNMSNSDLPEIAILTRGLRTNNDRQLEKQGYLYVSRLGYDKDLKLKEIIVLPKTSVDAFANNDAVCYAVCNMDLVFGYFRGRDYTQDLIVGDQLWRWDETLQKPVYKFQMISDTKSGYTIAADAIAAVQASDNDRDLLVFIWNTPINKNNADGYPTVQSNFEERWLGADGTTVNKTSNFATVLFGWGNTGPHFYSGGWVNYETTKWYNYGQGTEINSHPVLCKFADRDIAKRFKFIKYEVAFSEPRIYAAIAASPYYEDLPSMQGAETTWGKTSSTTDRTLKSDTWGGSVIAGFEHSFSMPFFSSAGVSVEFTAKVSASASIATEHEETISYGQSYSTTTEHGVVMQATPYDVYTYEIIGTDDPDEMGTEFIVAMPRQRTFIALGLQDYVRLTADQKGVGRPQDFLTSTPGKPFTYPTNYDNAPRIIRNDDKFPFLKGKALNSADDNATAEPGGIKSTRSISLSSSGTNTTSVEIGVETELVTTAGGTKVGVGFNYGHTMEKSHTIGQELSVEGQVIGMPSGVSSQQYPSFRWNVVWYYVKDANGEIYPVVNYIVTR
jgi:hypothetical protein